MSGCTRCSEADAVATEAGDIYSTAVEPHKRMPSPLSTTLVPVIVLSLLFLVCVNVVDGSHSGRQTSLGCVPQISKFRASNSMEYRGKIMPCFDDVRVFTCGGYCDSYEYSDFEIPFKKSHHPVCTYLVRKSRVVRLRRCHPEHPNPLYEVFDAIKCNCSMCNSEHTSCENLNG